MYYLSVESVTGGLFLMLVMLITMHNGPVNKRAKILMFFSGLAFVCTTNFWFKPTGVYKQLEAEQKSVVKMYFNQRNLIRPSVIIAEDKDGERIKCKFDTNLLFVYDIKSCEEIPQI